MKIKRALIALGAFAVFTLGVGAVAYNTGVLVSEADVQTAPLAPNLIKPATGADTGTTTQTLIINQPPSQTTGNANNSAASTTNNSSAASQQPSTTTTNNSTSSQGASLGTISEAPKISFAQEFVNNSFKSLQQILTVGVPQLLINFAGLVLLVMFLINSVKWLFAAGNDQATTDAKQGLLFTGIGFVVVMLAYAIVRLGSQIFQ